MDNTKDAVAVLRMMVAPFGARIEAEAIVGALATKDDARLSKALKAYKATLTLPPDDEARPS